MHQTIRCNDMAIYRMTLSFILCFSERICDWKSISRGTEHRYLLGHVAVGTVRLGEYDDRILCDEFVHKISRRRHDGPFSTGNRTHSIELKRSFYSITPRRFIASHVFALTFAAQLWGIRVASDVHWSLTEKNLRSKSVRWRYIFF